MKCSHCGAQLPEAETPRYCIYCGRPLERPGKDGGLESVLTEIRERFGLDALLDGQRTFAYFADLAPALLRERELLRLFYESGCAEILLNAQRLGGPEREAARARAERVLTNERWLRDEAAKMVCDAFLYALCPEAAPEPEKPATPPVQPPKPAAKPQPAAPARKPVSPLPTPSKSSGSPAATPEPWRKTPKPKKLTMTDKGVEMDGTVLAVTITIFWLVAAFLFIVIKCVIK